MRSEDKMKQALLSILALDDEGEIMSGIADGYPYQVDALQKALEECRNAIAQSSRDLEN